LKNADKKGGSNIGGSKHRHRDSSATSARKHKEQGFSSFNTDTDTHKNRSPAKTIRATPIFPHHKRIAPQKNRTTKKKQ
jgi:hypothetical protein